MGDHEEVAEGWIANGYIVPGAKFRRSSPKEQWAAAPSTAERLKDRKVRTDHWTWQGGAAQGPRQEVGWSLV